MGPALSLGVTAWRQLQGRALWSPSCPDLVPWGGIRSLGKSTASVPCDGCSIDRSPSALADSDAGVPAVVLCQPLRTERGSFTSLFVQTRNSSASAPPWAFTPSLACVLGLLREASEALRGGESSVSRRIPFQTRRKAKPGNILSLLLHCLCSLYWICW